MMGAQSNVHAFEDELACWVDKIWFASADNARAVFYSKLGPQLWDDPDDPFHQPLMESIRCLEGRFGHELPGIIADVELSRQHWSRVSFLDYQNPIHRVYVNICKAYLTRVGPPADMARRLADRLVLVQTARTGAEYGGLSVDAVRHDRGRHLDDCRMWLMALPSTPALTELKLKIMAGETLVHSQLPDRSCISEVKLMPWTYGEIFEAGRLTYAHYVKTAFHYPQYHQHASTVAKTGRYAVYGWTPPDVPPVSDELRSTLQDYTARLADEIAADVRGDNITVLRHTMNLSGSRWIVLAADLAQQQGLNKLDAEGGKPSDPLHGWHLLIVHLLQTPVPDLESEADFLAFVDKLRAYPTPLLKTMLPLAPDVQDAILHALGWQDAIELVDFIMTLKEDIAVEQWPGHQVSMQNTADPNEGVIDVTAACAALAAVDEQHLKEIMKLFKAARWGYTDALMILNAVRGDPKVYAQAEKSIRKRTQKYVKVYGLFPVERGEDEVLERYLFFQRYMKESKKYGAQRQANERAAAQAGLSNLAQVAGYGDAQRLEWAMEAKIAGEVAPAGKTWRVGDYIVQLRIEGAEADLYIERNGKALKSRPKAVRDDPQYPAIKQTLELVREQARRFRHTLENYMALGTPLTPIDLDNLNWMPVAQALLGRLIVRNADGTLGLCLPDDMALLTLEGRQVPINGPITIAHSYHLYQAGQLAEWQRYVVHRRIVQPFKQAFRELYLLTPAEEETRTYSNRFAGHIVRGTVAGRLLQSRGWVIESGDEVLPRKVFAQVNLEARFQFPDAYHCFNDYSPVTTDQISFHPISRGYLWTRFDDAIPLVEVPPLILSEVMRDADLVVAVAQQGEAAQISSETYQRRGDLILALLDDLDLENVRVEGHFAYVTGTLASYRVHLGSGVIHIEPGNYLCIVPDRWGQRHENLFLPFAAEDDPKISEIISKVLLLLADRNITDDTILQQIRRYTGN